MFMNSSTAVGLLSVIFTLFLCIASVYGGECLQDSDTSHNPSDYNQRLWSYNSNAPAKPSTSSSLKFITFNLQSGYALNCNNNVTSQALIMKGFDYLANEEVVQYVDTRCSNCVMPQIIANVAGVSSRYGMAMPYRTGQYGINVATSQTILDTKYALLTFPGREQRITVGVKTQPAALNGRYLWWFTVHVEYYSLEARLSEVTQLLAFINTIIAADPTAVIAMGGDFNSAPGDGAYTMIKAAGFQNAWEVYHGSADDGFTIPSDWPGTRFDHIWFKAPTGISVSVPYAEVPAIQLSDHRPFAATLTFSASFSSGGNSGTVVSAGPVYENNPVTITCPGTSVMSSILFASYGTPNGYNLGACVGGSSVAVVNDKCMGRRSCAFDINNNVFGDPCPHVSKWFTAQVMCK